MGIRGQRRVKVLKKVLAFMVAVALFLGISTAALAHSNNTPSQGNGNWQQMMDYCSEMMNFFMNNHQNNIPNETSTSKNLNTEQTNSNDNTQSTTNNHQNQNQNYSMYDDCW
jgi:disulfide bond formation protein DsbB